MNKMNVKMVEVVENSGMGIVLNREWKEVLEGRNFEDMVDDGFRKLMEGLEGEEYESDFYEVEGIVDEVGIIRFGEECGVYVIKEGEEWYNRDCDCEEFYDYVCNLVLKMY